MNARIVVYHKPSCSKCHSAATLLAAKGVEFETVNYYEQRLSADAIRDLLAKLGLPARALLRADEPLARELGLDPGALSDDEIVGLLVAHPDLLQRPIVVRGDRAVLGRPPENVEQLL